MAEAAAVASQTCTELVLERGRRTVTVTPDPDSSVLQCARWAGLQPPSSCETGNCATCIAKVLEGTVVMRNNEVLEESEVAEGWVLTCQGVPSSPRVHVSYDE